MLDGRRGKQDSGKTNTYKCRAKCKIRKSPYTLRSTYFSVATAG